MSPLWPDLTHTSNAKTPLPTPGPIYRVGMRQLRQRQKEKRRSTQDLYITEEITRGDYMMSEQHAAPHQINYPLSRSYIYQTPLVHDSPASITQSSIEDLVPQTVLGCGSFVRGRKRKEGLTQDLYITEEITRGDYMMSERHAAPHQISYPVSQSYIYQTPLAHDSPASITQSSIEDLVPQTDPLLGTRCYLRNFMDCQIKLQ